MQIKDLSRIVHDAIFDDKSQSLCSRAWQQQHNSRFWRAWVMVFGKRHCRQSFDWYWRD